MTDIFRWRKISVMVSTVIGAAHLRVSRVQMRHYIETGLLAADRTLGGAWDVDPLTLQALSRARGKGRRWSETTAWAALELLGAGRTDRLAGSQLSRLRAALRAADVSRLAYLAEGRGAVYRLRRLNGTMARLLEATLPSGASALDAQGAQRFGLAQATPAVSVVYVDQDDADELAHSCALEPAIDGDLLLRISNKPVVNDAVVALDLYSYGDTRESAAGRDWLKGALNGL